MVIINYKGYAFAHFASSRRITVSSQGSSLCEVPTGKVSVTLKWTHAVLCLAYFDISFVGERFKNKNQQKGRNSQAFSVSPICELRVPLRTS